jgi:hypothetical protein
MHFELAKYFLNLGNIAEAYRELRMSQAEKVKFYSYYDEVTNLIKSIESKL